MQLKPRRAFHDTHRSGALKAVVLAVAMLIGIGNWGSAALAQVVRTEYKCYVIVVSSPDVVVGSTGELRS